MVGEKKIEVIRKRPESSPTLAHSISKDEAKKQIAATVKQFLTYVVTDPEHVEVSLEEGEKTTIIEVDFAQKDFGRVVGSKGKLIGALRTLVTAMSATHDFRAVVRIKDEGRFF
jgi:predicted RNA-binding protein YlqC (UPF0109 family)